MVVILYIHKNWGACPPGPPQVIGSMPPRTTNIPYTRTICPLRYTKNISYSDQIVDNVVKRNTF